MNHNKSYNQNNSSHDNTFNFGNQLDISNGKKDKTGEMFFKEAYDFDDFQNIGDDKTVKSSMTKVRKQTNSNILKRDEDFSSKVIGNSILNDFQLSATGFHTKKVLDQSINKALSQQQKEPQFGDRKFSAQDADRQMEFYNSKEQFYKEPSNVNLKGSELSYSRSNFESQQQQATLKNSINTFAFQKQSRNSPQLQDYAAQSFRKKEPTNFKQQDLLSREEQFKQLTQMINFYKSESQKMSYERMMLEEESIPEIMNLANSQAFEEQIRFNMDEINYLNNDIEKERAIEKKLSRVISQLQEEYSQIVESVNQMDFQRPTIIKDEAKVLMDEINQLKKAFNELQIDNGSLNLSCTIPAIGTLNSLENQLGKSHHIRQAHLTPQDYELQSYLNGLLDQIHLQNSVSEDPQFLKNLKLACIKDEWTIFSNKQIIVSVDYKTCPLIKLRIGNKTNQELKKFTMQIQVKNVSVKYMQNEILNKKAFLLEGIKIDAQNLPQLFIRINISYQLQQPTPCPPKKIRLFCPTGMINFGEFTPLTFKQFETQTSLPLTSIQSPLKPLDKNFINSIEQIMLYIPNLKRWEGQQEKVFGLFMSVFNQGTLVSVEEDMDLLRISLRNGSASLLKLLEFVLTV